MECTGFSPDALLQMSTDYRQALRSLLDKDAQATSKLWSKTISRLIETTAKLHNRNGRDATALQP